MVRVATAVFVRFSGKNATAMTAIKIMILMWMKEFFLLLLLLFSLCYLSSQFIIMKYIALFRLTVAYWENSFKNEIDLTILSWNGIVMCKMRGTGAGTCYSNKSWRTNVRMHKIIATCARQHTDSHGPCHTTRQQRDGHNYPLLQFSWISHRSCSSNAMLQWSFSL